MRSAATVVLAQTAPRSAPPDHVNEGQASPDAELLALHARLTEQSTDVVRIMAEGKLLREATVTEQAANEAEFGNAHRDRHDTIDEITDITPTTLAGFRAKAEAVNAAFEEVVGGSVGEEHAEWHDRLAWTFARELMAWEPPGGAS
jgi:hypothetical protein